MEEISINVSLEVGITDPNKSGPSHFTRKRRFDHQEEVVVVPVAMGHPLEDLDLIVHPLQHTGLHPVACTSDNPVHIAG